MTKMAGKWLKSIPSLWPKRLINHTFWGRTYLYSPYKGVPHPRESLLVLSNRITHNLKCCVCFHWRYWPCVFWVYSLCINSFLSNSERFGNIVILLRIWRNESRTIVFCWFHHQWRTIYVVLWTKQFISSCGNKRWGDFTRNVQEKNIW